MKKKRTIVFGHHDKTNTPQPDKAKVWPCVICLYPVYNSGFGGIQNGEIVDNKSLPTPDVVFGVECFFELLRDFAKNYPKAQVRKD